MKPEMAQLSVLSMLLLLHLPSALAYAEAPAADTGVIARVTEAELKAFEPPEGVRAEFVRVDGDAALKISSLIAEPLSVTVAEIPVSISGTAHVEYDAEMACEAIEGSVYLEMYAVFGGQAYFSRELDAPFTAPGKMRAVRTPFFVSEGQTLDAVRLGVRFEGPGTVTVRNMRLEKGAGGMPADVFVGRWFGLAGGLVGIIGGLWGMASGLLVPRGRGRTPLLAIAIFMVVVGGIALIAGLALWGSGVPSQISMPFCNLGAVVMGVFGVGFFAIRRRYAQVEEQRMRAMDLN